MNIQKITLHNFKNITDFEHEFDGGVYLITGENEVGKSSLMSAIVTLLTGERSDNLLKKGKQKGQAKMVVGEGNDKYEVELRFSSKQPRGTFTITQEKTGLFSDRISMLESIFDYHDFDAHEFTQWSLTAEGRRKQVEMVRGLLPQDVNLEIDKLAGQVEKLKDDRKELNIHLKANKALLNSSDVSQEELDTVLDGSHDGLADLDELYDQKSKAQSHNEKHEGVAARHSERKTEIDQWTKVTQISQEKLDDEVKNLEDMLKAKKHERDMFIKERSDAYKDLLQKQADADTWLNDNPIIDINDIDQKIQKGKMANERSEKINQTLANLDAIATREEEIDAIEDKIEKKTLKREKLINSSQLPISGLSFTNDGLLLGGIPYRPGDISTSQEMEVAAKLIIAKNPSTKVFMIARGESLGADKLKSIVEFAQAQGYQGFIEEVHRGQEDLRIEEYNEKE